MVARGERRYPPSNGDIVNSIAFAVASYFRRARPAPPPTLRRRVTLLLSGGTGHGFAAPLTTPSQRYILTTSILASAGCGSALSVAAFAGLRPVAAELPAGAPVAIAGLTLLYRKGDPDAEGLVLSVACARMLESASIPAVDSDSWLLADMLAPGDVFGGKSLSE